MSMTSLPSQVIPVQPLREGDRLSREEFHHRYLAMPQVNKAELIDGVVFMPSPVRSDVHSDPHFDLVTWLGVYRSQSAGIRGGDNGTVRLKGDNEVQPDAFLYIQHSHGGQARLDADGYLSGGPELVAEIAASTSSRDRNEKMRLYRDNGVNEYILWRTEERAIDWFVLRERRYEELPLNEGILKSETFPGLWLDPQSMLRANLAGVLATLAQGLASAEHAAFVAGLQERADITSSETR